MLTARRDKILKWPYSDDRVIGGKFTSRNGFIVASCEAQADSLADSTRHLPGGIGAKAVARTVAT